VQALRPIKAEIGTPDKLGVQPVRVRESSSNRMEANAKA